MRKRFLIPLFLSLHILSFGQLGFEYSPNLKVIVSGDSLRNPWAGGLDYIQISDFDFDFDGEQDLFIFDRSSNNIRVYTQEFINGEKTWLFQYGAASSFPEGLIYRAQLIDYDADGRKDIFTYGIGGLKVYRNTGNATDGLQWELIEEIVESDYNGFVTGLFVAASDIPAITDVDFDGDIDVLTFHQGGQNVEYHKNLSMELYGVPDSLEFELRNECWGKFSEDVTTNSILLNDPDSPCEDGDIENPEKSSGMHAGSTLLALDYDNSGVMDLVLGDVSYTNLYLLLNGGSAPNTDSPMISADGSFPSNSLPVDLHLFPAAYFIDVDFDGVKDLVVGANAKNVSENEASILFYKNTGSNSNPAFSFTTREFLQAEQIDHGKGSIPIIADVDNDGLEDLVVSNLYRFKDESTKESTIAWYKNTGSISNPEFTFIDYDFLNLSNLNLGFRLVPTFGDIDDDGFNEIFIGLEDGSLSFVEHDGASYQTPSSNYTDNTGSTIDVGGYAAPQLVDINEDGLLDLVIGTKLGVIYYYQNIGSVSNPSFEFVTDNLGSVSTATTQPNGYCIPHFFKENNQFHLFAGALDGKLHYYNNIANNLNDGDAFDFVNGNYLQINCGAYSSFFVHDINANDSLNLFAGQDLGGVYHFEVNPESSAAIQELKVKELTCFPNPTSKQLTIYGLSEGEVQLNIYSLDGKIVLRKNSIPKNGSMQVSVLSLSKGIYTIVIESEDVQFYPFRFVKE